MTTPKSAMMNYTSELGSSYLTRRAGAASDHVQALRASLFIDLPAPNAAVLDFGCGTGGVLEKLNCGHRIGVEIGESAAAIAKTRGIEVHKDLTEIPNHSVDAIISFHALEHVEDPVAILRELLRVAKPNASVRLIVPGENPLDRRQAEWRPNRDMHLFTWTPLNFGNLAKISGFNDIQTCIRPMPTGSRLVHALKPIPLLSKFMHHRVASKLNSWNVILNCTTPSK